MATLLGTYTTDQFTNVLGGTKYTYKMDVRVEYEQSIANNTTTLYITPTVTFKNQGSVGYAITLYFKVDGSDYSSKYWNFGTWGHSCTADSACKKVITHNDDGTKSFTLNVSCETNRQQDANAGMNEWVPKWFKLTEPITLPTIPRTSSFSVPTFTTNSAGTITIDRKSSSFTHDITYLFGSVSGTIATGVGASTSWTPSRDLAKQIPNETSGVGTITVTTYSGTTKVGTKSGNFTLKVDSGIVPSFSGIGVTGNNLWNGLYLTGKSSASLAINGAAGSYSSTIKSYSISGPGISTSSSSGTTNILNQSGYMTYTATITDSRGRSASKTTQVYVHQYDAPVGSFSLITRCNSAGTPDNSGEYGLFKINSKISDPNSTNSMKKTYSLQYRKKGDANYSALASGTLSNYIMTDFQIFSNTVKFDTSSTYELQLILTDSFTSTTVTGRLSGSACVLNIERNGIGVGKYYERGSIDIQGDMYVTGSIQMVSESDKVGVLTVAEGNALKFNGNSVPDTATFSFTPFFYDEAGAATFTTTSSIGKLTYLGDLVFVQGRIIATYKASKNSSYLCVGGFGEANIYNYPAMSISFFGGTSSALNSLTYAPRAYMQAGASNMYLAFDYRDNSWQRMQCSHLDEKSNIDLCFSGVYRYR